MLLFCSAFVFGLRFQKSSSFCCFVLLFSVNFYQLGNQRSYVCVHVCRFFQFLIWLHSRSSKCYCKRMKQFFSFTKFSMLPYKIKHKQQQVILFSDHTKFSWSLISLFFRFVIYVEEFCSLFCFFFLLFHVNNYHHGR